MSGARIALVLVLAIGPAAQAKPPTLTGLFPAGAARGQSLTVAASGTFDRWPPRSWTDAPGLRVEAGDKRGELSIHVADDAEPGVHWLRLYDEDGATALRPFLVGMLPEVNEAEPNDEPGRPMAASLPATINGRLAKPGDVDGFAVTLSRGQTLVADVEANRNLGSPMDAVLQVASAAGFVLAQNDDTVGHDPRLVFEAPADGTYTVRLFAFPATPDSSIRLAGGDAFLYRLTLTAGGFLDHAFPLAVGRDGPAAVAAVGPSIPEPDRMLAVPGGEDGNDTLRLWHPRLAGTATVRRVAGAAAIESEPDDPGRPQALPDPGALSGWIDPPDDRDVFALALKKGDRRVLRIESRALGLPLDAVLRVRDSAGKVLAESDDVGQQRDPELTFAAPADGEYRVEVRDLNGQGGPRFAYLLTVGAPEPDFALTLKADRAEAARGESAKVDVTIARKDGFAAPIEIDAEGLPDGVSAEPATSAATGDSAKKVTLTLRAGCCGLWGPFRIVGRAAGDPGRRRPARASIDNLEGASTEHLWLTVRPAAAAK